MRNGTKLVFGVAMMMGVNGVMAMSQGSPEEAKQLSQEAISAVATLGVDKAFAAFSDPKGKYQKKDLYVFCLDMEGKVLSHAKKPELVGQSLIAFNKYGDEPFKKMVKVASAEKEGWVDYKWPHPASGDIQDKRSYIISQGSELFCGVGAYK